MADEQQELARILLQAQAITQEQLARARVAMASDGFRLREALVRLGFASEQAVQLAASKHWGIPYASLENNLLRPDPALDLPALLAERFARDNCVLPLFLEDGVLTVAAVEPRSRLLLESLRVLTGKQIQAFVSTAAEIRYAIGQHYGGIQPT